ncbi:hypothetical protein BX589_101246 [Paraburkholderia fungorum]|jgi:hypothetical protein|uniref:hypothetical protein n=1 Tax=Paraburkholderia fungorum TaxID=134537 RepID=UPI000D08163A|nr:hypothetical protein [Paraburkholderia fungorum]PRZ56596.1 hypothetical protein BX589_101246 [Paraburkholderia fungorum]
MNDKPVRVCAKCKFGNRPVPHGLERVCRHPRSPVEPVNGWLATCTWMRTEFAAPCGVEGALWEAAPIAPPRTSLARRVARWLGSIFK